MQLRSIAFALLFGLPGASAMAAHTQASLALSDAAVAPGDTVVAGIHLRVDPGWHVYWRNSGASGIPTAIHWDLPRGVTAGEVQWPVPEKLPPDDLLTYIYQDEVVLLVPLKIDYGLPQGSLELRAKVSWLECKEQCVPGSTNVTAFLSIGRQREPSDMAALIHAWQAKLPRPGAGLAARAWWEPPAAGDIRPVVIEWNPGRAESRVDFFPYGSEHFEVQGATERLPADPGKIRLRKQVKRFDGDWPKEISGLLIQGSGDREEAYEVTLPVSSSAAPATTLVPVETNTASMPPASPPPVSPPAQPLWRMLFYAFLGGLILNVMPCVLPVIALKILGFVGEARNDPRHVRWLGLCYGAGVLCSFLALAALVIGVQSAGHRAGWGMQFSNPQFIVVLTVLVTLVALDLFGLFEINLSGRVLGPAGALASRSGSPGAFFNGVLATVLATPCTAPFLSVALGFAFAQSAPIIVVVFLAVGAGLAFPYVVLSCRPSWLKFLPKPGPWMEKFKIAMGFPMLATAVWLFSLAGIYYGKRTWWLGVFLVVVAMASWIYGEFIQRSKGGRWLAALALVILLAGGYAWVIDGQLNWRRPIESARSDDASGQRSTDGISWEKWNPRAVAHAQEEGQPVLVDFTADWCLTCQANKRIAIDAPSVQAKLKETGTVTFLGDYTRFPDDITRELNRYGRAGVPLVLVYPGKAGAAPIVLPELLTPHIVLAALDRATK